MSEIRPFTISIPDSELEDLKSRLNATRWPEAEPVDDWTQGTPLAYAQEIADYWANTYDWRSREAALNRFDQFTTELSGVDIHFIHQRSPHEDALPLLITHGWPGSVVEFHKVIEPLVNPTAHGGSAEDAFHVVCPSLPGFGFSGKPAETGWGIEKIAEVWNDLMTRLGYDRYMAQGGDWGSAVTTEIGRLVGGCIGIHTNMPIARPPADALENPSETRAQSPSGVGVLPRMGLGIFQASGHPASEHRLRPGGFAAGQMAWIMEKFWAWTDNNGSPEDALDRDEMLDNIMLYWLTSAGASSARIYWEASASLAARPPRSSCRQA